MGGSGHIKTGHLRSHPLKSRVRLATPKVLALRLKSASRDFLKREARLNDRSVSEEIALQLQTPFVGNPNHLPKAPTSPADLPICLLKDEYALPIRPRSDPAANPAQIAVT